MTESFYGLYGCNCGWVGHENQTSVLRNVGVKYRDGQPSCPCCNNPVRTIEEIKADLEARGIRV